MTLDLAPQIAAALAPLMQDADDMAPPPAGDVEARRTMINPILTTFNQLEPAPTDVTSTDYRLPTADGDWLLLRWYTKEG
jgi:hypothetical protein